MNEWVVKKKHQFSGTLSILNKDGIRFTIICLFVAFFIIFIFDERQKKHNHEMFVTFRTEAVGICAQSPWRVREKGPLLLESKEERLIIDSDCYLGEKPRETFRRMMVDDLIRFSMRDIDESWFEYNGHHGEYGSTVYTIFLVPEIQNLKKKRCSIMPTQHNYHKRPSGLFLFAYDLTIF